ncbi:complex I subunit 4 family protein [Salsipaludibacter albus]|uniref:complex I subunit 4 family protein n=1 Tax=Salsipaludibacter albus TaxID=2849650 RepID=UPI001EE4B4E2|nr:NADH-quinone oxidoreductase subunit M [Salsipaludibacter albus]MBY5161024.1 NADH-quinone oxidoreductase subunit M [Salsipaludibacter albus]
MLNDQGWLLSLALFFPLIGAAAIVAMPSGAEQAIKRAGVLFSGITLALTVAVMVGFDYAAAGELQFETTVTWIEAIGARYHLGIDGISLPLFALTSLLTFLCAIYTTKIIPKPGKPKAFLALMMLLQVGMAGTFLAFDLVLFFVFWEVVLVPMYFMIGMWGGPRREYASVKFFLYTLFGSVFMLVAFLSIYFVATDAGIANPWDIVELSEAAGIGSYTFQTLAFLGIFLGFAIKVPVWPFHTWLPDAHTEAPTVGSVLLAGVLLKMGTYGFIRIALPILPEGALRFAPLIGVLGVIGIIYGSLACLAQTDVKRLIAFSSVGHMGFVMLGISAMNTTGIQAALYGNIAHAVVTGMLFFLAGSLHERYHTREISEIGGGMLVKMPRYGALLVFVSMASLGLPGLAGFWGEFTALWAARSPAPALAANYSGLYLGLVIFGAIGTVLTAGYFLWLIQRVGLGTPSERWADEPLSDVMTVEWVSWLPLLALILIMGIFPVIIFGVQDPAVTNLVSFFGG